MPPKRRVPLAIPTNDSLPHHLRLAKGNPEVAKTLSRLSRPSLLSLAVEWCQEQNVQACGPYLDTGEEDDQDSDAAYTAAQSLEEVIELYEEDLPRRKGTKREVVDRIIEGDWRHGISLKQLAMAETQYILEHPNALRWTAFRFAKVGTTESGDDDEVDNRFKLPRFNSETFLQNLRHNVSPLAKAHYHHHHPSSQPVTIIRIYLHDTPYNTQRSFAAATALSVLSTDGPKSIFLAFPDAAPFVYISLASNGATVPGAESKSIQRFIVSAIPKSISTADEHYELQGTSLTARSLDALLALRGNARTGGAGGGWSVFASDDVAPRPLDFRETGSPATDGESGDVLQQQTVPKRQFAHADPTGHLDSAKRTRLDKIAKGRFGSYGAADDGIGLQRFDVKIEDPFPSRPVPSAIVELPRKPRRGQDEDMHEPWSQSIRLSFQGTHVFAGIRALVENGVIDGERLPGWMTGEAGVSIGTVRDGRISAAGDADGG